MGRGLDDEYEIEFDLITTAKLTDSARVDLATFQENLANDEDLSARLILVDETELRRRYDFSYRKRESINRFHIEFAR